VSARTHVLSKGQSNLDAVIALLNSWRDVSAWAKGSLIADWKASGYLTEDEAVEVAAKTGART
jgi:hypothetical protein